MIGTLPLLLACLLGSSFVKPTIKISAWVILDDDGTSVNDFKAHAKDLQSVSFSWMGCDRQGMIRRHQHPASVDKDGFLKVAKANGVTAYAMTVNDGFTIEGIEKTLSSAEAIQAHADALVKIAMEDGFGGIDLDYESLQAKDRVAFTQLVQAVSNTAHAKNLKVAIALHAKESEPGTWDGPIAQDYAAIGKAVDEVRVMTYDNHWETSEAGPIAPPDWVDRVMNFAATVIPPAKLEAGIPGYGYDWLAKKAHGIDWSEWSKLISGHGAAERDPQSQELILHYNGRTVYFSDSGACKPKFSTVRKLGLNGFALWRMGSEDPSFWSLISKQAK